VNWKVAFVVVEEKGKAIRCKPAESLVKNSVNELGHWALLVFLTI
jgi:hypothetical protein